MGGKRMVVDLRLYTDDGRGIGSIQHRIDKGAEGSHADGSRLQQPRITVDTRSLIEPPFFQRGICPHTDKVVAAIVHILRHVIHLCGIAARLRTQIEAVEPHTGITEDAVKPQGDVLAQVFLTDGENLPIPAHTRLRVFVSDGLIAVRMARIRGVGKDGHPVVRHRHLLPRAVVKLHDIRTLVVNGIRLRQIIKVLRAATEVLRGIRSIPERKPPAVIQPDNLTHTLGIHDKDCHPYQHHHHQSSLMPHPLLHVFNSY